MRFVFLGSPPFATPVLERLLDSPHVPALVVTPPARPRGRGRGLEPSPVATLAREAGVSVLEPGSVRDEAFLDALRAVDADVFLVVSYGELLRQSFLDLPKDVCLNVHPSLLPRHRGATPIPAALLAGDRTTGVSIQRVVLELDAGDILVAREADILPGETAGELAGRLATLSGELVIDALDLVAAGDATYTPQDESAITFCTRLTKQDGEVDWAGSAADVDRRVRAMNPWPLAFSHLHGLGGGAVKIAIHSGAPLATPSDARASAPGTLLASRDRLVVACGVGAYEITLLQAPGKRALPAPDFLRGARIDAGAHFGGDPSVTSNGTIA